MFYALSLLVQLKLQGWYRVSCKINYNINVYKYEIITTLKHFKASLILCEISSRNQFLLSAYIVPLLDKSLPLLTTQTPILRHLRPVSVICIETVTPSFLGQPRSWHLKCRYLCPKILMHWTYVCDPPNPI